MKKLDKIITIIKNIQAKLEQLTIDIDVGDYWTVDVDFGDYWTLHKELAALAVGTPQIRLVDELGASMRNVEQRGQINQSAYRKLQSQLQDIIVWLA